MLYSGLFKTEITQKQIDEAQKSKKYAECLSQYHASSLDADAPEIRKMKLCLYQILNDFLIYDPVHKRETGSFRDGLRTDALVSVDKEDPQYAEEMRAVLLVLYYCVKNRSFNYALPANAGHYEISQTEALITFFEENAERLVWENETLKSLLSALMVLLFDKLLSATVELYHEGERVPESVTSTYIGNRQIISTVNYKNTSRYQKINALTLKVMDDKRGEYQKKRDFWYQMIKKPSFPKSFNTFLYGTYDLCEMNAFLAQFRFRLYDISTKYYANYFCGTEAFSFGGIKKVFYTLTGNQAGYDREIEKHREWTGWELAKQLLFQLPSMFLFAVCAVVLLLLFQSFNPNEVMEAMFMTVMVLVYCVLASPPMQRKKEKKKRIVYSLMKI